MLLCGGAFSWPQEVRCVCLPAVNAFVLENSRSSLTITDCLSFGLCRPRGIKIRWIVKRVFVQVFIAEYVVQTYFDRLHF